MAVRKTIPNKDGLYFITITCARWLSLFEISNGYDIVYSWFKNLIKQGHFVCGYVIMPNHLHALIGFRSCGKSINSVIGNGKRFMAYALARRLQSCPDVVNQLKEWVNDTDRNRGKIHEVFEPSFDWKECTHRSFIEQKLNYIHDNPCRGNWNLVHSPQDYQHSSARFYQLSEPGEFEITSYNELQDIDLTWTTRPQSPEAETLRRK